MRADDASAKVSKAKKEVDKFHTYAMVLSDHVHAREKRKQYLLLSSPSKGTASSYASGRLFRTLSWIGFAVLFFYLRMKQTTEALRAAKKRDGRNPAKQINIKRERERERERERKKEKKERKRRRVQSVRIDAWHHTRVGGDYILFDDLVSTFPIAFALAYISQYPTPCAPKSVAIVTARVTIVPFAKNAPIARLVVATVPSRTTHVSASFFSRQSSRRVLRLF